MQYEQTMRDKAIKTRRALMHNSTWASKNKKDCGKTFSQNVSLVRNNLGHYYLSGFHRCGNGKDCPQCSPAYRAKHADWLRSVTSYAKYKDHTISMITPTIPHRVTDTFPEVYAAFQKAWSRFARELNHRKIEWIWHEETTISPNGFHPHFHVLMFHKNPPEDLNGWITLENELFEFWLRAFQEEYTDRRGANRTRASIWHSHPSRAGFKLSWEQPGVDDEDDASVLSQYVSKFATDIGAEMSSFDTKEGGGSLTMFQALCSDDPYHHARFMEYAEAQQGKRFFSKSKGIKEIVKAGIQEERDNPQDINWYPFLKPESTSQTVILKIASPTIWWHQKNCSLSTFIKNLISEHQAEISTPPKPPPQF